VWAHYLIHACDYKGIAELALPARAALRHNRPVGFPHALQHAPPHIFTRLGPLAGVYRGPTQWAAASGRNYAARTNFGGAWDQQLHAMDYLAYAYLQGAQDVEAKRILDELVAIGKVQPENLTSAYGLCGHPAALRGLKRRRWADARCARAATGLVSLEPVSLACPPRSTPRAGSGLPAAGRPGEAQKRFRKNRGDAQGVR